MRGMEGFLAAVIHAAPPSLVGVRDQPPFTGTGLAAMASTAVALDAVGGIALVLRNVHLCPPWLMSRLRHHYARNDWSSIDDE